MKSTPRLVPLVVAVALLAGACVPPPEDNDEIVNYRSDTTMGAIQDRGELVIGLQEGAFPWGVTDGAVPGLDGFTHELGALVASSLGVQDLYRFAETPEELLQMVESGEVDMAFPLLPLTERRARQNTFTDPYWVGHQRLLVPANSSVEGADDLSGQRVCSFLDPDTGVPLTDVNPQVGLDTVTDPRDCTPLLRSGQVAAATASDVYLLQIAENGDAIVGEELTTEGYSAAVTSGATDLASYVDSVFAEAEGESDWSDFYDDWIGWVAPGLDDEPPDLTLEEAATLYPRDLE